MESIALQNPVDVCPPSAIVRRVRIAFVVAELMMNTMRGYPEDGAALKRECGAGGHRVFQPLRHFVSAVRQQAVIAHANADVDGEHVEDNGGDERLPGEEEEGNHGADVEGEHEDRRHPVAAEVLAGPAQYRHVLLAARAGCSGRGGRGGGSGDSFDRRFYQHRVEPLLKSVGCPTSTLPVLWSGPRNSFVIAVPS